MTFYGIIFKKPKPMPKKSMMIKMSELYLKASSDPAQRAR